MVWIALPSSYRMQLALRQSLTSLFLFQVVFFHSVTFVFGLNPCCYSDNSFTFLVIYIDTMTFLINISKMYSILFLNSFIYLTLMGAETKLFLTKLMLADLKGILCCKQSSRMANENLCPSSGKQTLRSSIKISHISFEEI